MCEAGTNWPSECHLAVSIITTHFIPHNSIHQPSGLKGINASRSRLLKPQCAPLFVPPNPAMTSEDLRVVPECRTGPVVSVDCREGLGCLHPYSQILVAFHNLSGPPSMAKIVSIVYLAGIERPIDVSIQASHIWITLQME